MKANNQRHEILDANHRIDKAKEVVICLSGLSLSSKTLYKLRKGAWLQRNQNKWPRPDSKLNSFFYAVCQASNIFHLSLASAQNVAYTLQSSPDPMRSNRFPLQAMSSSWEKK